MAAKKTAKQYYQERTCRRKTAYTKKEADEQVIRKYWQTGRGGYSYNCPVCGWWHITKQWKPTRRPKK